MHWIGSDTPSLRSTLLSDTKDTPRLSPPRVPHTPDTPLEPSPLLSHSLDTTCILTALFSVLTDTPRDKTRDLPLVLRATWRPWPLDGSTSRSSASTSAPSGRRSGSIRR